MEDKGEMAHLLEVVVVLLVVRHRGQLFAVWEGSRSGWEGGEKRKVESDEHPKIDPWTSFRSPLGSRRVRTDTLYSALTRLLLL